MLLDRGDQRLWREARPSGPVLVLRCHTETPDLRNLARLRIGYDLARRSATSAALRAVEFIRRTSGCDLVLEDPGGVLLSSAIPQDGMRLDLLIRGMHEAARALNTLHGDDVLHNDVRPDAMLVSHDLSRVWFVSLDAGTTRRGKPEASADLRPASAAYAPPERSGRIEAAVDERSDLYSLGATLFQMCLGHPPFAGNNLAELAYAHIARPVPDPCEARPELPQMVGRIVVRLLQKDPDARYPSAIDLERDLAECLRQFDRSGTVRSFDLERATVSRHFRISDRLYSREVDLARLGAVIDEGLFRHRRTVVSIKGPSGIGKTAILDALRWQLAARGAVVIGGKFDQFLRDRPYTAFVDAARSLLRPLLGLSEEELDRYRRDLATAVGDYGRLLTEIVPELATILGPQPPFDELPPPDATRRFTGVVARFLRVFARQESPLVLFLDDLQWADPASLNLLNLLSEAPGLDDLMLVLGFRSNEVTPTHPAHRIVEGLHEKAAAGEQLLLGALSRADILTLLCDTLSWSGSEADKLAELLLNVSGGNIFFIREYLASLHASRALTFDEAAGRWRFDTQSPSVPLLPVSTASILAERLNNLLEGTFDLLSTASCIGDEFDVSTLSKVHDLPRARVAQLLDAAVEATIIVPTDDGHRVLAALAGTDLTAAEESVLGNGHYRFRHDQLRNVVHERLGAEERAARHLRIGMLVWRSSNVQEVDRRAVEIFGHFVPAAALLEQSSHRLDLAKLGLVAGNQAQSGLAFVAARRYLEVADRFLPDNPWHSQPDLKLGIMMAQAKCADALNDRASLDLIASEILSRVRDPLSVAEIQSIRIRYLHTSGHSAEALNISVLVCRQLGFRLPRHPSTARSPYRGPAYLGRTRVAKTDQLYQSGRSP